MRSKDNLVVRFWGVRGSHPVGGEQFSRFGGNTPCVEIQAGGHTLIFDAGTGIINLGRALMQSDRNRRDALHASIFLSHLHHDHTQGLPFFAPLYQASTNLNLFLPDLSNRSPESILADVIGPPLFPVSLRQTAARKHFHALDGNRTVILGPEPGQTRLGSVDSQPEGEDTLLVRPLRSYAHPQGVIIYRIEWRNRAVVYATDTEGYVNGDRRLVRFARGADLLIHDAQYRQDHYLGSWELASVTQGFGHSTAAMACKVAADAGVDHLVLFHHDPNYDDAVLEDVQTQARAIFPCSDVAREGMEIVFSSSSMQSEAQTFRQLAV